MKKKFGMALVLALAVTLCFGSVAFAAEPKDVEVTVNWSGPNPDVYVGFSGNVPDTYGHDIANAYASVSGTGSKAWGTAAVSYDNWGGYNGRTIRVSNTAHLEGGSYTVEAYNSLADDGFNMETWSGWGGGLAIGQSFHEEGSIADVSQSLVVKDQLFIPRSSNGFQCYEVTGASEAIIASFVQAKHKDLGGFYADYSVTATASSPLNASGSDTEKTEQYCDAGIAAGIVANSNIDFTFNTGLSHTAVLARPGSVVGETTSVNFDYIANYVETP